MKIDINFFMNLEKKVWEALKNGDLNADADLLSDDFLGVYESGISTKEDHLNQLMDGPIISSYKMGPARLLQLGNDVVSLTYSATAIFLNHKKKDNQTLLYITSIWALRSDKWVNIFSQDTKSNLQGQSITLS